MIHIFIQLATFLNMILYWISILLAISGLIYSFESPSRKLQLQACSSLLLLKSAFELNILWCQNLQNSCMGFHLELSFCTLSIRHNWSSIFSSLMLRCRNKIYRCWTRFLKCPKCFLVQTHKINYGNDLKESKVCF